MKQQSINETSARLLHRAAKASIKPRAQKEQEFNYSTISDDTDPQKLQDAVLRALQRTERAKYLAQNVPNNKNIRANDLNIEIPNERTDEEMTSEKQKVNESLKIIEEAFDILTSLFEVDDVDGVEDKTKEHNKIKRVIKDKEGNNTEVVSVEDELFPYAGNAKQQFNQKIIAKINDMIEGKATLEDLIQLIKRGTTPKKVVESLEVDEKFQRGIKMLEGLLVNDGRGCLLKDIDNNLLGGAVQKKIKDTLSLKFLENKKKKKNK